MLTLTLERRPCCWCVQADINQVNKTAHGIKSRLEALDAANKKALTQPVNLFIPCPNHVVRPPYHLLVHTLDCVHLIVLLKPYCDIWALCGVHVQQSGNYHTNVALK